MIAWLRRTMVAGVVLLVAAGVWAGEPAVEAGPKEAEFERLFAEWKGTLDQLHVLRDQYRRAQPGRREGLPERYAELLSQGEREFSALKVAAEAACLEDPGVNLLPADFLAATIDLDCNNDAYEEAFRMAKIARRPRLRPAGAGDLRWRGHCGLRVERVRPRGKMAAGRKGQETSLPTSDRPGGTSALWP